MGLPRVVFRVCETNKCPKYQYGDAFTVSGVAIMMETAGDSSFVCTTAVYSNQNRDNCEILYGDLVKIVIKYERADQIPDCLISCSGCVGSIRLEHSTKHPLSLEHDNLKGQHKELAPVLNKISKFSFFRNVSPRNLAEILQSADLKIHKKDEIVLRKGEQGKNLYIVITGEVTVLNETGISISTLGEGEVFGEMSLICDQEVGSTIQAKGDVQILSIHRKNFQFIMDKYPSLHRYFNRLLAKRLAQSNKIRSDEYASGMIGKLEEIPTEALFQTLHANAKTGILTISEVSDGTARFSMRQGALIKASYAGLKGKEAFFKILREKKGRFKFNPGLPSEDFDAPEIGYFMKLLMEGLQNMDELGHEEMKKRKGK
ncbi:MAG: cyclic nucleotide-binding domain-containing protein [Candidatus Electrothrix aestuarii]|uniref:Cyclic nucleotide-binding domain-containing protein n=1 Tax=Candidatus Electrothrix aestuarii TaxID=3062594 RepID=A0AAU8LSC9_9BACT|nr:cyclic nucleotide-binding domain-containing protein [Candidatus Electrothrix aestuarii]WPD21433.1 MAG: cyclic nucleotide-binding domain-containing protein [Candidatus Electrothrix sp. GW3-3]